MKRLHIPFVLLFMSLTVVKAQTFTFNMLDVDNNDVNYEVNVNMLSGVLSASCNATSLFEVTIYTHEIYKEKNWIAFALKDDEKLDVNDLKSNSCVIIRDNGYIIINLPDGKEYRMEAKNWLSHVQEYDRLEKGLEDNYSEKPTPSIERVKTYTAENGSYIIFTVKDVSFTMIKVKGGEFMMGVKSLSDRDAGENERPAHKVTLSDYWIGQTEVTQELWTAIMGYNPSMYNEDKNYPVEQISWNDCMNFIARLNNLTGLSFRMPTEAEWEFAARGGNKGHGYKFSGSKKIDEVAWSWHNSGDRILRGNQSRWSSEILENNHFRVHPVATKAPNELGIYDMTGNVWEWCHDWFGFYTKTPQTNPTGPPTGIKRVYRGGCWEINDKYCRVTARFRSDQKYKNYDLGLRLALDLQN